jgi:hypothetical protein
MYQQKSNGLVMADTSIFFTSLTKSENAPLSFISNDVSSYIENVETQLGFVSVGENFFPCTVNHREFANSYVTSNYYVIHHKKGMLKGKTRLFVAPILTLGGQFLKLVGINRCVNVNNWLMTNALYPQLNKVQYKSMIDCLTEQFPMHYLMFRNLNIVTGQENLKKLKELGCYVFPARSVYLFDPSQPLPSKARYHFRRDKRLMESGSYRIKNENEIKEEDLPLILGLYKQLYIDKFTTYSPRYSLSFLRGALETGMLKLKALYYNKEVVGVLGFQANSKEMIVPFFGYDQNHPHNRDIYRLLIHTAIVEAQKRGVILNDGSGGDQAKKNRGMKLYSEYSALYTKHLPLIRRSFWKLASFFS